MAKSSDPGPCLETKLQELGARFVHIGVVDLEGEFRDKRVSTDKAVKLARNGYPFCEVLYFWDIAEKTHSDIPFVDRPAKLFPDTVRAYPFANDTAVCLADFVGEFGRRSPRNLCLGQIEAAAELGIEVHSAFEFEFFVFDETAETIRAKGYRDLKPFAPGNRTYSLQTSALYGDLLSGLDATMATLGITLDAIHTELGPGCFEAPIAYSRGIGLPTTQCCSRPSPAPISAAATRPSASCRSSRRRSPDSRAICMFLCATFTAGRCSLTPPRPMD